MYQDVIRQQGIERRQALSADEHARLSTRVCTQLREHFPQLAQKRVAFCWPINNEPDLRPLIAAWIESNSGGFTALLPVVQSPKAPLAFRVWTPTSEMAADRYGIPTPVTGEFQIPEALLIPLNGFDAAGYRIGYGGGFFDRTLAAFNAALSPPPLSLGVGFELSRVDTTRPQAHDVRLDGIVTEAGAFMSK